MDPERPSVKEGRIYPEPRKLEALEYVKYWWNWFRALFGWAASAESEFMRFRAAAGMLPALPDNSPNAAMITGLLGKNPRAVRWDEIATAKIALVAVMPLETLQSAFGSLAEEYESVTGTKPFAQEVFPNPPRTIEEWRAGVVSLMVDVAKFRRARIMFERKRATVGLLFVIPLTVLVGVGFQHWEKDPPPIWQCLVYAGFLGAGFSVLTRLYPLAWSMKLMSQVDESQVFRKGIVINYILSLGEGVIAACVIYLLFRSGLLTGQLFPEFDPASDWTANAFSRLFAQEPRTTTDMAKMLLWAFMAGFTERLVPDQLSRLAGEASAPKKEEQS